MDDRLEFPVASDDWGTVSEVFFPGRGDVKIGLGNITIEYSDLKHHPACFPDGDDTSACHPECPVRARIEGNK